MGKGGGETSKGKRGERSFLTEAATAPPRETGGSPTRGEGEMKSICFWAADPAQGKKGEDPSLPKGRGFSPKGWLIRGGGGGEKKKRRGGNGLRRLVREKKLMGSAV